MAISQQFAPPFKLIAPFFIISLVIFIAAIIFLFGYDVTNMAITDNFVLSFVHLFLLGFVMMGIFGAMAQLVPVVLEVEHFAVELYYVIYPLLFIATIMMVFGFYNYPLLLSFGGVIAFISFAIFLFETFMTLLKVKKQSFVSLSVIISNLFLLFGLIAGLLMAFGFSGFISVDFQSLLRIHIFLVFFGYVGVTIMGMSYILIPMFWLSHSFDVRFLHYGIGILSSAVVVVVFGELFHFKSLFAVGFILSIIAFSLYLYEIYLIYATRVRMQKDIYFYYIVYFMVSFFAAISLAISYYFIDNETILKLFSFVVLFGVVSSLIVGHLYKIVPFLIWFERFSPLVGKEQVPMLADMVPERSANFTFYFHLVGFLLVCISLVFGLSEIFKAGCSFMVIGAIFLLKDIVYMINFKG